MCQILACAPSIGRSSDLTVRQIARRVRTCPSTSPAGRARAHGGRHLGGAERRGGRAVGAAGARRGGRAGRCCPSLRRLLPAARAAGVQVVHCTAYRRADGKGANTNARLFMGVRKSPVRAAARAPPEVEVLADLGPEPEDLVLTRTHGLDPMAGTDLDPVLRNLGVRTIVVTGRVGERRRHQPGDGRGEPRLRRGAAPRRGVRHPAGLRRRRHRQHARPPRHHHDHRRARWRRGRERRRWRRASVATSSGAPRPASCARRPSASATPRRSSTATCG